MMSRLSTQIHKSGNQHSEIMVQALIWALLKLRIWNNKKLFVTNHAKLLLIGKLSNTADLKSSKSERH